MDGTNYVAEAIRTFGGITETVLATGIPERSWYRMRREGRIKDSELCFFVAEKTGIAADKLARHEPGRDRIGRRKLRTRCRSRARRHATRRLRSGTRKRAA